MAIIQPSSGLETGLRQQARAIVAEAEIRGTVVPRHAQLSQRARDMLTRHEVDNTEGQDRTPWVSMPTGDAPAYEGSSRGVSYGLRSYESSDGAEQAVDVVARQTWPHPWMPENGEVLVAEETLARLGGIVCFELAGAQVHEAGVTREPNNASGHFPAAASIIGLENVADTLDAIESALRDPKRLMTDVPPSS